MWSMDSVEKGGGGGPCFVLTCFQGLNLIFEVLIFEVFES